MAKAPLCVDPVPMDFPSHNGPLDPENLPTATSIYELLSTEDVRHNWRCGCYNTIDAARPEKLCTERSFLHILNNL
jgi:hypothetical protein